MQETDRQKNAFFPSLCAKLSPKLESRGEANEDCRRFRRSTNQLEAMGCRLSEPFLHLAFLPLPVIPHLRITDLGLVDVDRFELVPA